MEEVHPRPTPPGDPLDLEEDLDDDVGDLLDPEDDDGDYSKTHLDFVSSRQKKTNQKSWRKLKFIAAWRESCFIQFSACSWVIPDN